MCVLSTAVVKNGKDLRVWTHVDSNDEFFSSTDFTGHLFIGEVQTGPVIGKRRA